MRAQKIVQTRSRVRGRFIVLEGADGSGKSTQAVRLVETLRGERATRRGTARTAVPREVLHVRDPGSTRLAEAVRAILLDPAQGHVAVEAEVCLYLAARAQLLEQVVAPALRRGADVVCERWTLSTEVYQGVAGGFGADRVRRAARALLPAVRPDVVIVLDVAVGAGLQRLGRAPDRMEQKGDVFHARVVRAYRRLARTSPRHTVVPAGSPDDVHARIVAALEKVRD